MIRLEPLRVDNLAAALAVEVRADQASFVEPVAESLAEAYVHGDVAWPRLVVEGRGEAEVVVGFVMAFIDIEWDPETRPGLRRSGIWRLNVAAEHQGRGIGRLAVRAVCEEFRSRDLGAWAYVTWESGEDGPEGFWRRLGFDVLDEPAGQQRLGRLSL